MNNDLISRAEAINVFDDYACDIPPMEAIDEIRCLPAVDAQPVRHGKNVTATHPHDMFVCSDCGFSCEITELRYDEDGMGEPDAYEYDCKFCPNCGAKMDGDSNET